MHPFASSPTSLWDYMPSTLKYSPLRINQSFVTTTTAAGTFTHRNVSLVDSSSSSSPSRNSSDLLDEFDESLFMLPYTLRTVATISCVCILLFGVTGNLLVPFVVCKTRELCTNSTNVFLINLSVADLLVLIVCMPTVFIELHSKPEVWTLGETMCKLTHFLFRCLLGKRGSTVVCLFFSSFGILLLVMLLLLLLVGQRINSALH